MSLEYRPLIGPVGELGKVYSVYRNRRWIGYAARWRTFWLAGKPDGFGTWHLGAANTPILHRRRDDVTLRLAMTAEGLLP